MERTINPHNIDGRQSTFVQRGLHQLPPEGNRFEPLPAESAAVDIPNLQSMNFIARILHWILDVRFGHPFVRIVPLSRYRYNEIHNTMVELRHPAARTANAKLERLLAMSTRRREVVAAAWQRQPVPRPRANPRST